MYRRGKTTLKLFNATGLYILVCDSEKQCQISTLTHSSYPFLPPSETASLGLLPGFTTAVVYAQVRTLKSHAVSKFKYEGLFQDNPR